MDAHSAMDEWETSPFEGGLEEAARMASRGFSGAIESGTNRLFIADGDPVAVVADFETAPAPADTDAFEGASGQAHEAPHPTAARLVPMLALGGEVRGEYFSDDTPVGTVEETLAGGGFTGYVELAENVLSGDYYAVFDDGEAEYVAFIGSTEQLVTGTEAESKTKNEVGIYSVTAVDLPDVDLPDAPEPTGGADAVGGVVTDADSSPAADAGQDSALDADTASTTDAESDPATDGVADPDPTDETVGVGASSGTEPPKPDDDPGEEPATESDDVSDPGVGAVDSEPIGTGDADAASADAFGDDAGAGEDRSVPSVDPERSGRADDGGAGVASEADAGSGTTIDPDRTGDESDGDAGIGQGRTSTDAPVGREDDSGASAAAFEALRSEIRGLRSSVDRLENRVAALEQAGDGDAAPAVRTDGPSLSPSEALSKTTLFVREGTRGGPTLQDAHDGRADRDALASNLGLERHTRFDEAGATVDGEPYDAFIESSQAYEFVQWLTNDLLFEIRVTNSEAPMSHCYDAIPQADRVFFNETVTVEDGGEAVDLTFDVVVRDRNGAPLFVATLDDSREPTASGRIETLVTDASDLCAANKSVVGAFAVTSSYFEPEALDVAQEATTSSLLSREKFRSFVNLTRKNGFHLCLVESREASLHLTLPEL